MKMTKRLAAIALCLSLITTCMLGGTLAKYTNTVTGTGTVTAAAWSFKANEQTETFTLSAVEKIAPGETATYTITIDASGSEVDVDYSIEHALMNGETEYSGADFTLNVATESTAQATGTIQETAENKSVVVTYTLTFNENVESVPEIVPSVKFTVTGTQADSTP